MKELDLKAHSWFKSLAAYGERFPERVDEMWEQVEARQETCPHNNVKLLFRIKMDGSDYEYSEVCQDCWFNRTEWS